MAKIQKSYRLEKDVICSLEFLVEHYNATNPKFSFKKATATDIISLLILKEFESLKNKSSFNYFKE